MARQAMNLAYRRYVRRMVPISLAYIAGIGCATAVLPDDAPPSVVAVAIALLPGLAAGGWIWAMGRLLIELDDEYLRLLEVRKFLTATGVTLAATSLWGLVELFTTAPRVPIFFVFPLWCLALIIGQVTNRIAFGQRDGACGTA